MPESDHEKSWLEGRISRLWHWRPAFIPSQQVFAAWRQALEKLNQTGNPDTLQVYVHFPYCRSKCRYCMYWSRPLRESGDLEHFVSALLVQLEETRRQLGLVRVSNAYCGGGTPSLLSVSQLDRFLGSFSDTFKVKGQFSFEANPGSLDRDKIAVIEHSAVNRVSFGVQSMEPEILKTIGRNNPPRDVIGEQIHRLRSCGIQVNVDLVIDLPGQTAGSFRRDFLKVLDLKPDTITVYRYLPVIQLPHEPGASLRYSSAIDFPLILLALSRGYVYLPTGVGDDSLSVIFIKASTNCLRAVGGIVRSGLSNLVLRTNRPPGYVCFDHTYSHLMGLGTGSFSHIHGFGWYRDVSSLESLSQGGRHVYYGTRFSSEEECCITVMHRLVGGRWLSLGRIKRDYSWTGSSLVERRLVEGAQSGVLDTRLGRVCLNPAAPEKGRNRFLLTLMPEAGSQTQDLDRQARKSGVDLTGEVQLDLIPSLYAEGGRPLAIWEWLHGIGISEPGDRLGEATVSAVDQKTISFRIMPEPAPLLDVLVDWERGQQCYGRSKRYALSWIPRGDNTGLTAPERRFLDFLLERTQGLDSALVDA
jgi:coproporphyrinogen III oxidase-like Fe-S oxidoreductase